MTPFNPTLARAGHPVVTRDGQFTADVVRYDLKYGNYPLLVILTDPKSGLQRPHTYTSEGKYHVFEHPTDLFMAPLPEKTWSKPEDVPGPVCWLARKLDNGSRGLETMVINVGSFFVTVFVGNSGTEGRMIDIKELSNYEHSTDRITWKPCTTARP